MATIVWRLNSVSFESLRLENPVLTIRNRDIDTLSFDEPTTFDSAPRLAYGSEVVLTKQIDAAAPICFFRGRIRQIRRSAVQKAERVRYLAFGAWEQLTRRAYLQSFKVANDPSDPASTLTDAYRGRVILGQNVLGVKVTMGQAVTDIINYAVAGLPPTIAGADVALGTITLPQNTIWDEATDLSCADAINRVLTLAPDAVGWFDYSVNPPAFNCARRASLASVAFAVHPVGADGAYAPLEQIEISPRYDLLVANVAVLYLATNRANASSWKVVSADVYPPGTTGREDACLVRTVELAGSSYSGTMLEQKIVTLEYNSSLDVAPTDHVTSVSDPFAFDALVAFWKVHYPKLTDPTWEIISFTNGRRLKSDGTEPDPDCDRELISGAITDWMIGPGGQGVKAEEQAVFCDIEVEITDPLLSALKSRMVINASASVMSTNTDRSLFSVLAQSSFTPAEDVPVGVAHDLYTTLSQLQFDGTLQLAEKECTNLIGVQNVLNLTGGLAEWTAMRAMVQEVVMPLDLGRTQITIGPAKTLGQDDLVDCYRINRNRPPVTSYYERTSGQTGGQQQRQGLTIYSPIKPGTPALIANPVVLSGDI